MFLKKSPAVSVLIPAHNEEKYLLEAVNSVLNQTFSDLEIIIIDDASTDNTANIAKLLAKQNHRIKLIRHKNKKYRAGALNSGLKKARGKFICFLDGDDIYLPEKIEKQLEFLKRNRDIDMVYSNFEKMDEHGGIKTAEAMNFNTDPKQTLIEAAEKIGDAPTPPYKILGSADSNRIIPGCSPLIRKRVFRKIRLDENLIVAQDYDLWFQIIGSGFKLAKLPIVAYRYRYHSGQISKKPELREKAFIYIGAKLKRGVYFKKN
jgi:glycosyltransferase involved in cell wall biosynthesis